MKPSSRTPEGEPNLCPVCGNEVRLEASQPAGDAPCPHCGHLLWFWSVHNDDSPDGRRLKRVRTATTGIVAMARSDAPRDEIVSGVLPGLLDVFLADTCCLWTVADDDFQLEFHCEAEKTTVAVEQIESERRRIVAEVFATGDLILRRGQAADSTQTCRVKPIDWLVFAAPLDRRHEPRSVIEVVRRPSTKRGADRGMSKFLDQMSKIMCGH
jgi:hypothetical protein